MFRLNRTLLNDFIDLMFPTLCLGCSIALRNNEKVLCAHCRINLPETGHHRGDYDKNLLNKFAGKGLVQHVYSYFYFTKGSTVQKLIHAIKYKGQKEAAKEVAVWYGQQLRMESNLRNEIDLILGIPTHKSRLQQRGYNQADWIAAGLAESLDIPTQTDVLVRNQFVESQTNKNRIERWENVSSVFAVLNQEAVKGKRIAVVDDVLTTGATIGACASELVKSGCTSVSVLTLAAAK